MIDVATWVSSGAGHCGRKCPFARLQGVQAWLAIRLRSTWRPGWKPRYAKRVSPSKLDPYAEKLSTWLQMEVTKSRKQRRNLR